MCELTSKISASSLRVFWAAVSASCTYSTADLGYVWGSVQQRISSKHTDGKEGGNIKVARTGKRKMYPSFRVNGKYF